MSKKIIILALVLALIGGGYWLLGGKSASDAPKKEEHAEGEAGHAEEGEHAPTDSTEISQEAATKAGIVVEKAVAGTVYETITLTGRITLNQNTTGQVKARFPGIVREVKKGQGETVKVGDVLATVESNDSLQV